MNNSKNLYLITLMFLAFLLYVEWQKDYGPKPQQKPSQQQVNTSQPNGLGAAAIPSDSIPNETAVQDDAVPQLSRPLSADNMAMPQNQEQTRDNADIITEVETPLLKLKFSAKGAALVYAELKNYPIKKGEPGNVVLFDYGKNNYRMESGLLAQGVEFSHLLKFNAKRATVNISQAAQTISFTASTEQGQVTKSYLIDPGHYQIEITQTVSNQSSTDWLMSEYQQLRRNNQWQDQDISLSDPGRYSFKGSAFYDLADAYEKMSFEDMKDQGSLVKVLQKEAWIAMVQHYFISAVVPQSDRVEMQSEYKGISSMPYLIRYLTPPQVIAAGQQHNFKAKLFVGPKLQTELPKVAKGLDLTVDYGMFTTIAKPLFWVLDKIHALVGNWGWAIVFLTVLIKLLFFKLSEAQYRSMAKMRKLQPRIVSLKELHKGNRQKFNEEMMKLYKKEKVNPLGGCLPMLVQIPVFIALYWVLLESVELRQAPFMLWLQDLSSPDPYYILPAINAAAMIASQRLTPASPGMDPMQQKIMKFMPIAFAIMFAFFQSGLVLYWTVNSVLSFVQQWVITKRIEAQDTQ